MKEQSNNIDTIASMLSGMGRQDSLHCGSEFMSSVKGRIADRVMQREKSVKFNYLSLSVLIVVLVINMACIVNVVSANNTESVSDQMSYLYSVGQDSHDVYWLISKTD